MFPVREETVALVTGGAGFIGHHVVEHLLRVTPWNVVTLDRLDISGNLNRLQEIQQSLAGPDRARVRTVFHDLKASISEQIAKRIGPVDYIFHLAASTHVERSITEPIEFVYDNVIGTANVLEYVRRYGGRMLYFSTDEVFGPAAPGQAYKEWDRYKSSNPYSATKAGAEELCIAYANTYRLDIRVSHCMNVFGERQHPEKFVPLVINKVLAGQKVYIHANADLTQAGSRFYIHARNVADAALFIMQHGRAGNKYNIVGEREVTNLEMAMRIASVVGKPLRYELVSFHASRPGHDLRYALDGSKLAQMGWQVPVHFEESLRRTVEWTLEHPAWL